MAKLNPSVTHNSNLGDAGGGAQVNTDDVSLRVFMEHCEYPTTLECVCVCVWRNGLSCTDYYSFVSIYYSNEIGGAAVKKWRRMKQNKTKKWHSCQSIDMNITLKRV
jgi:hypothetical protein